MDRFVFVTTVLFALFFSGNTVVPRQDASVGDTEPILTLQTSGPTSFVTSLAFSPESNRLYAGGWDKMVHVWSFDSTSQIFRPEPNQAFRVPVGPELQGAINAIAVSSDGKWLAVGGLGVLRDSSGFRGVGFVVPNDGVFSNDMKADQGVIYVFNTATREVRTLRGHMGPVTSLAFSATANGDVHCLASVAQESRPSDPIGALSVRLWNVDTGESKSMDRQLSGRLSGRPTVAAWQIGNQWNDQSVVVADALMDTVTWNPASGKVEVLTGNDRQYTAALDLINRQRFTYSRAGAAVTTYAAQDPTRVTSQGTLVAFPEDQYVSAMTLLRPSATAPVNGVGVTLLTKFNAPVRLAIVDSQMKGFLSNPIDLWQNVGTQPVLASSNDGEWIAAAGNDSHEIHVFRTKDLKDGNARPVRLQNGGDGFRSAILATKNNTWGILLGDDIRSTDAQGKKGRMNANRIFDPSGRSISKLDQDLSAWTPNEAGFADSITASESQTNAGRQTTLSVQQGGKQANVRLLINHQLSDFAYLPANSTNVPIAILAVASRYLGQPRLELYNAENGERLRELRGHTEAILSTSFSADGRFLITAGRDKTVCVWSMIDLFEKHVGKNGGIQTVAVANVGDKLLVTRINNTDGANQNSLAVGDEVTGMLRDGRLYSAITPNEFYKAFHYSKPGEKVGVQFLRGGVAKEVQIPVTQGIDDHKPLFSFFATTEKNSQRDWIAWSPLGPYESSSADAEGLLGWHFNTGKKDMPTLFSLADQYRGTYYHQGLASELLELGKLRPAAPPPPLDRPRISVTVAGPQESVARLTDGSGWLLRATKDSELKVNVYDMPANAIASVEWGIDNAPPTAMKLAGDSQWQQDLHDALPKRGVGRIYVTLITNESIPQRFTEEIAVRVQPSAPGIVDSVQTDRVVVTKKNFDFKAEAKPGSFEAGSLSLSATLQKGTLKSSISALDQQANPSLAQVLELSPGDNVIEIVARNTEALKDFAELETTRVKRTITYNPVIVAPPEITIKLPAAAGETASAGARDSMIVASRDFLLSGSVRSAEPLTIINWFEGDPKTAKALSTTPSQNGSDFQQSLTLKPGVQSIHVVAKTENSIESQRTIQIDFRPSVPTAAWVTPTTGMTIGDTAERMVDVTAQLTNVDSRYPFTTKLLLNRKPLSDVAFDSQTGQVRAKGKLTPGQNRFELELSNQWGNNRSSEPVIVTYRVPPAIVRVTSKLRSENEPFANVTAEIRVLAGRLPKDVEVNGNRVKFEPGKVLETKDGIDRREIVITELPLEKGNNAFSVRVADVESWSEKPGRAALDFRPVPPPKPVILVLSPKRDVVVAVPTSKVEFQIRSTTPLRSVELMQDRKSIHSGDVKALARDPASNEYVYQTTVPVSLNRGPNQFSVRAINSGGEGIAPVLMSYTYTPILFTIERVESTDGAGKTVAPVSTDNQKIVFDSPVANGRASVVGRIKWVDTTDPRLDRDLKIKLWVNGFQQLPVQINPRASGKNERTFRADVVLNQTTENIVNFELPSLEKTASNSLEFSIPCSNPVREQNLHLLVIGADKNDPFLLKKRALDALQVRTSDKSKLSTPAFSNVRVYGPLAGSEVTIGRVNYELDTIRSTIDIAHRGGSYNHVIMLFYEGQEKESPDGRFRLVTFDSKYDPSSTINSDYLQDFFSRTPGAHVMFLDVLRTNVNKSAPAVPKPGKQFVSKVGLMRYSWQRPMNEPTASTLFVACKEAFEKANTLGEVESRLREKVASLGSEYRDNLSFDGFVPEEMSRLVIGAPAR